MPNLHQKYEAKKARLIASINRRIRRIYKEGLQEVSITLQTVRYNGKDFRLKDYPVLNKKVKTVVKDMNKKVYAVTVNGLDASWKLAMEKNDVLVEERLKESRLRKRVAQTIFDPNAQAIDRYIDRRDFGLKLSDRIWHNVEPFKDEMERQIGSTIAKGRSTKEAARDLKKHLLEPNREERYIYRNGRRVLSPETLAYNPGRGIYRSSYKNAFRVARTETNIAYRTADHERWKTMPFVKGVEIKLSASHKHYDICDQLKGVYPKGFKFVGWHPQCLCYEIPQQVSDKEFEAMEDAILSGEELPDEPKGSIKKVPKAFDNWIEENRERVKGWRNTPYFMRDNPDYL
jgi:hypothetical protein